MILFSEGDIMKKTVVLAALSALLITSFTSAAYAGEYIASGPGHVLAQSGKQETESTAAAAGNGIQATETAASDSSAPVEWDITRVKLSTDARLLVRVEGTGGTACTVTAFEKAEDGSWKESFAVNGWLGLNGMNTGVRHVGDKTTPVGLYHLNTPFGIDPAEEGFPKDYIQVDESYTWTDLNNKLEKRTDLPGEVVGKRSRYGTYYDYCLDMGFNREAVPDTGSALFIHCGPDGDTFTSGCVQIPKSYMKKLLKLYGKYGEKGSFIALAPAGRWDIVY